jgi:Holliday junction DNA helicase RuvA
MIDRLKGKLLEKSAGRVVVEVAGGIGLSLQTPLSTFLSLPTPPSDITLMVRLVIREESWDLFGFSTKLERDSFDILTSVSRIGPKLALTIISAIEPQQLAQALITQDLAKLSAIKGIGVKTAERLIVELKDKAVKLSGLSGSTEPGGPSPQGPQILQVKEEAIMALINLGYSRAEAEKAIRVSLSKLGSDPELGELVRQALQSLSS